MNWKTILLGILLLFISLINVTCSSPSEPLEHIEKNTYNIDYEHPEKYIISGNQSTITEEEFTEIAQHLQVEPIDLSALKKIYTWKDTNFNHISSGGKDVGKRTINDILEEKVLTGCHDHGLVIVSLLRKYGVPAIFVDATGIDWALQYPEQVTYFSGHIFVELFLNNKWILFCSTSGAYIPDYDPTNPIIPITTPNEARGYYVMFKGLDPEDYGITDIQQLNTEQKRYARMIKEEIHNFVFPNYTIEQL